MRPSLPERFWSKVQKTDGCWLWQGATTGAGYGGFNIKGDLIGAHRVAYELTFGPIPDGLLVCHTCDVRHCVNPAHLFLGTHTDNMQDCKTKGRTMVGDRNVSRAHPEKLPRGAQHWSKRYPERVPRGDRNGARKHPERLARGANHGSRLHPERILRGEHNPHATLTTEQVLAIRALQGVQSSHQVAKEFAIVYSTVCRIWNRTAWAHVP